MRPPVIGASADGTSNLQRPTMWKGHTIGGPDNQIKMWIIGSCSAGFHMEPQGVHLLSKCRFKDALLNNCMQNSSDKPTSRTKQLKAVQKLMAHNKQLTLQFATHT